MKQICAVYRSPKKEGMYLYVDHHLDLAEVPEALLLQFGKPERAMTLVLHPDRKLARADVVKVMEAIAENGYYLQMPPQPEAPLSPRESR